MGEAQATRDAAYQTADIQRAAREPVLKELQDQQDLHPQDHQHSNQDWHLEDM